MDRRDFSKSAAATTAAAALAGSPSAARALPATRAEAPGMLYRELGTTGERVSAIGLGGAHVGLQATAGESVRLIRSAIDRGITFLDNCWDYNGGQSEVRMGKALDDGYRQKVFLMTKMDGRTVAAYNQQLDQSLSRLGTDTIDLVQFHEVIRMDDPERIFAPGGAMEAAVAARKAGKIRYIGFTGHKDPAIHLHMFETAAKHNFKFDTVQMPVNVMDPHFHSFIDEVIPVALKAGTGVLAMKTFGDKYILRSKVDVTPIDMLHFGLSQPVSVVITGIDKPAILDQALEAARTFQPLTPDQRSSILARTAAAGAEGKWELFKTSTHFDGTTHNPQWLG